MSNCPSCDVCVVGGGYSGTMVCANLIRLGYCGTIVLVERGPRVARGVAYDPPNERLLLNVPVANMGAWADDPSEFHRWLIGRGREVAPGAFVSRAWYGEYLEQKLTEAVESSRGRLSIVRGEAVAYSRESDLHRVALKDGREITSRRLVLALGNLRPGPLSGVEIPGGTAWWHADPWSGAAHRACANGERVMVIGTGLTMVDVCVSLTSAGARPRITVLSRNGLLPCVHATPGFKAVSATPPELGWPLRRIVRHVRREARRVMREGGDWRAAVDCLRPMTRAIWAGLSAKDRERFVRLVRTPWDVHRHRVPAEVIAKLVELQQRKSLRIVAGRVRRAEDLGASARVTWLDRATGREESAEFDRVINCTGARTSIDASPLLGAMAAAGIVRSEEIGLGVQTDAWARAIGRDGTVSDGVWVVGPLRRGTLWESTAVPDLREQALDAAREVIGDGEEWGLGDPTARRNAGSMKNAARFLADGA
ncbi:MAG: FAD/NAD(P)-binding protein [Phycisphaerales bacterium]|nr:FAD/NAD(P)-binding protein [Phycisphaerales bacterium]